MKKSIYAVLMILLIIGMTCASAASSPKNLFLYAKSTLRCLAAGDYDSITAQLPVSGISPDRSEWEKLAVYSFSTLYGHPVQTEYAVAYRMGSYWRTAVPVSEPCSGSVEVLFLDSEDGNTICGYGRTTWDRVVSEYISSDNVIWNNEYFGGTSMIESDTCS